MYSVKLNPKAYEDVSILHRNYPKYYAKLGKLLDELAQHPRSGTGQAERLKHYEQETWSRRLSKEHRLVYEIHDDTVIVLAISAYGHYM